MRKIVKASEGKLFRRKADKVIFGKEIILDYTYCPYGVKLNKPILQKLEDFEEIDEKELQRGNW